MDLLIAATAHAHGAALYARNLDDFTVLEPLLDIRAARGAGQARPAARLRPFELVDALTRKTQDCG